MLIANTDMIYFQLWICYALYLAVALILSRGKFTPAVAFYTTWFFSIGLLGIGSLSSLWRAPQLPESAFWYLVLAGGVFLLGTGLAHAIGRRIRKTGADRLRTSKVQPKIRLSLWGVKLLAGLALVFTFLHVYRETPSFYDFLQNSREIRAQATSSNAERSSLLSVIATTAAMIVIPVALMYWIRYRKVRWWMAGAFLAAVLLALLSIGKFLFIFCGLTFINMFFYERSRARMRSLRIGSIIGVFILVLGSFFITEKLRARPDQIDEPVGGIGYTIYVYATGYIPAFAEFYEEYRSGSLTTFPTNPDYNPDHARFGNQTFSSIYRLLAQIRIVSESASGHYEGTFNVYTLYRDLIMDFGVGGSLLCVLGIGFFSTFVYRLLDLRKAHSLVFLALMTTQMEFTLIYSLFGFLFYPIILAVSPFVIKWRTRSCPKIDLCRDEPMRCDSVN